MERLCRFCRKDISHKPKKALYCNANCKNHYAFRARSEKLKRDIRCVVCDKDFYSKSPNKIVCCSDECKRQRRNLKQNDKVFERNDLKFNILSEYVECKVCGLKSQSIASHIRKMHGISTKEYCEKFPGESCQTETYRKFLSDKVLGAKNPAHQHGGKFSPFSDKFIGKAKKEDVLKKSKESRKRNHNNTTSLEYYTFRGMSLEDAIIARRERQQTFSLKRCIEKYGEQEGKLKWQSRQEKWLSNFKKQNYSNVSQTLFWSVYNQLDLSCHEIYFATLNTHTKNTDETINHEYCLKLEESYCKPDFYLKDLQKVIEFDGEYWHHANPNNMQRDLNRQQKIEALGIKVLRVREKDYKASPETIVYQCLEFLNE